MCRYGIGKQNFEGLRTDRRRAQVTVMQELLPRSIRHTNYSVIKRITNHTSTSQLRFQGYPLGDDLEPTHPFQRITGGASFKVTRDLRRSDVPPACIMDLRAVEGHVEIDGTPIVRLTWTWPGAHMTHGVAFSKLRDLDEPKRHEGMWRRLLLERLVLKLTAVQETACKKANGEVFGVRQILVNEDKSSSAVRRRLKKGMGSGARVRLSFGPWREERARDLSPHIGPARSTWMPWTKSLDRNLISSS
ncbi:uncharacterized protein LOC142592756 isoform X1 [Dermacentor variabilis]|uniref:uncharacterized protein LOC142592756 isoform X1 n=1 Tax=Dermacentor variabilis TaxID=34621 RepID=UPI003F5B9A2D